MLSILSYPVLFKRVGSLSRHRQRACASCLAAVLYATTPHASADNAAADVRVWLTRMAHAVNNTSYQGIFIYRHGEQMETLRIIHQGDGTRSLERLVSLSGPAREIIRDRDMVRCILRDKKAVVVDKSQWRQDLPKALAGDATVLARNYRFAVEGQDRVAGRITHIVAIQPKDAFRYGYRLWLDTDTAIALRSDLLDEQGMSLEQTVFTEIEQLAQVPQNLLQPETGAADYAWYRQDSPPQDTAPNQRTWHAATLPQGFTLTRYQAQTIPDGMAVDHLVFSDGLAVVSAYVKPDQTPDATPHGVTRMGAMQVYSTRIDGHPVTVMGAVPQGTVRMIADSLKKTVVRQ